MFNKFLNFFAKIISVQLLFLLIVFSSCSNYQNKKMNQIHSYAFRLKPGQDLKKEIQQFVSVNQIQAGWIGTCVGSLQQYQIRFSNQNKGTMSTGHFEILSLTGTVSVNGSHLHIAVSDSTGTVIGGHLLDDNIVYTTAEIVIQFTNAFVFKREKDGTTPWDELQVIQ